jgi:SAM-dependent methyltransferase
VSTRDAWLAATWPFVADALPRPPARVLEIGCGPEGGFVPRLLDLGHDAVGVDPEAPAGDVYHRRQFEEYSVGAPVDAVVACTSLHHVSDLGVVLDKVADSLVPGGVLVIVEWDWQRFDEATALWCFDRLPSASPAGTPTADTRPAGTHPAEGHHRHGTHEGHDHDHDGRSWLEGQRDEWAASGLSWHEHLTGWTVEEGLHPGQVMLEELDRRFDRLLLTRTPYFFADLDAVSAADEQAAIDAGALQATGIHYVGRASVARASR